MNESLVLVQIVRSDEALRNKILTEYGNSCREWGYVRGWNACADFYKQNSGRRKEILIKETNGLIDELREEIYQIKLQKEIEKNAKANISRGVR
jgi:hypothetical protein